MLKEKALVEVAPTSGPPTLTSLNIPPERYSSMHKLLETQSTGENLGGGLLVPLTPERTGVCNQKDWARIPILPLTALGPSVSPMASLSRNCLTC